MTTRQQLGLRIPIWFRIPEKACCSYFYTASTGLDMMDDIDGYKDLALKDVRQVMHEVTAETPGYKLLLYAHSISKVTIVEVARGWDPLLFFYTDTMFGRVVARMAASGIQYSSSGQGIIDLPSKLKSSSKRFRINQFDPQCRLPEMKRFTNLDRAIPR